MVLGCPSSERELSHTGMNGIDHWGGGGVCVGKFIIHSGERAFENSRRKKGEGKIEHEGRINLEANSKESRSPMTLGHSSQVDVLHVVPILARKINDYPGIGRTDAK